MHVKKTVLLVGGATYILATSIQPTATYMLTAAVVAGIIRNKTTAQLHDPKHMYNT